MSVAAKPSQAVSEKFGRPDDRPVEFWPTSAIRAALDNDDLDVWQRIVAAIKRDPFGRTARQVEEVLETEQPYGVSAALSEVLDKAREHLEDNERTEVSRHVRQLLERSELGAPEFASRIGIPLDEFTGWLDAVGTPSASMMIRMRRLSDRFARIRAQRAAGSG
ncbi:MAG: XRE family transcriptional regulator [Mycobacterium sp.]